MMVTEFRNIDGFRKFNLSKKRNTHSVCEFTCRKGKYAISDSVFKRTIKVYDCEDTDTPSSDTLLMSGNSRDIKCMEGYSEDLISVTIMSKSVKLERETHTRIFQNAGKTYRDILNYLRGEEDFEIIFLEEGLGRDAVEQPVVQINETDMEFICRIALMMGSSVWVDDKSDDVCQIRIGDKRGNSAIEIDAEELIVLEKEFCPDRERIRIQISNIDDKTRNLDIGKQIRLDGRDYIIDELNIRGQDQVYRYEYLASRSRGDTGTYAKKTENMIPVYHFVGKVIGNKDPENRGRVQVDFNSGDIQDISDNNNIWIDMETIYDGDKGGVVFIPDIGDFVDVLWDGKEFVITGVRRMEDIGEEHRNIDEKSIIDRSGRKIYFAGDGLRMESKDSVVMINDDKVEIRNRDLCIVAENGTVHMDINKNLECNVEKKIILEGNAIIITGKNVNIN